MEIAKLATALNEFQAELVTVGKDANNPFFKSKYADLGSIMKAAQPVLTKHGLSVIQLPSNIDGKPALTTTIMHTSGESQSATVPLILAKEDPQGVGSAITYMRRYSYAAALQIVIDEDDDGNSSITRPTAVPAKTVTQLVERHIAPAQLQMLMAKAKEKGNAQDKDAAIVWLTTVLGKDPLKITKEEFNEAYKKVSA